MNTNFKVFSVTKVSPVDAVVTYAYEHNTGEYKVVTFFAYRSDRDQKWVVGSINGLDVLLKEENLSGSTVLNFQVSNDLVDLNKNKLVLKELVKAGLL